MTTEGTVDQPQPSPHRREKTANEYMRDNPDGKWCSRCGDEVHGVQGDACVCWRCTNLLTELRNKGYWRKKKAEGTCPGCGGERPKGKQRCPSCAKERRRDQQRQLMRSKRVGLLAKQVSGTLVNIGPNEGEKPLPNLRAVLPKTERGLLTEGVLEDIHE